MHLGKFKLWSPVMFIEMLKALQLKKFLFSCRKVCTNCSCDKVDHVIDSNDLSNGFKMKQIADSIIDDNANLTTKEIDHYLWVPPGLDEDLVFFFFMYISA